MGQKIKSGTGMCDIYLDEEEMFKNMGLMGDKDNVIYENEDNIDTLLNIEEEGDCTNSDFKFSFE